MHRAAREGQSKERSSPVHLVSVPKQQEEGPSPCLPLLIWGVGGREGGWVSRAETKDIGLQDC